MSEAGGFGGGGYADKDPEDAWDDGDDSQHKLDVIERVVIDLSDHHRRDARHEFRRSDALRLLFKIRRHPSLNDRIRAARQALEAL